MTNATLIRFASTCLIASAVVPARDAISQQTWESAPSLTYARSAHAVVSTRDAIYVIGGTGDGGAPVLPVEKFEGKKWVVETSLPGNGLNAPAAAIIGNRIYVVGGFNTTTNVPSSDVLVYDIAQRKWSNAAPLPAPRGGHAAIVMAGKIHVIGGGNSVSTLADHSEYDPATNRWTERAPLLRSKGSPAAVVFNGKLYSIGGRSGPSDFGDVDVYDEATDQWTRIAAIEPRGTAGAAAYCNTIFLFGGESQAKTATLGDVLRFDASDSTWKAQPAMPTPRNFARAVLFKNSVYVVGGNHSVGMSHSSSGSTTVERFHTTCGSRKNTKKIPTIFLIDVTDRRVRIGTSILRSDAHTSAFGTFAALFLSVGFP